MNKRTIVPSLIIVIACFIVGLPLNVARSDDPPEKESANGGQDHIDLLDGFFGAGQSETDTPKKVQGNTSTNDDSGKTSSRSETRSGPAESASAESTPSPKRKHRDGDRIEAVRGFQAGRQLALLEQRPLFVLFGAEWCQWCRKLEEELTTEDAKDILERWVVAFVDVDFNEDIAKQFQVSSLPSLRIVDGAGAVIASQVGYKPLGELETWLDAHYQQADPVLQTVLFASNTPDSDEVKQLADLLSWRSASVRTAAAKRLIDHRSLTAPAVVDKLRVGNLSSQLAALEILTSWNAPTAGIDPWVPGSINTETTVPLVEWIRELPTSSGPEAPAADASEADSQNASEILKELITAPASRQGELIRRVVSVGDSAATESRRMESTVASLNDIQRQLLRQVRYSVFAGRTTRLTSAGLIESLAQLDGPTHYAAAEKLLLQVTSQDEPLIDELSMDRDPLVRELAVAALHRVGALTSGERIRKLLSDESPSVRTAVLNQLSEKPDDEITKRLVDYLLTESDEDLLIYATKILGKLATSPEASDALVELIDDDRWRVRAAALDSVSDFVSENRYSFQFNRSGSVVSEPVADAVLNHTNDPDPFVAKKAQYLVPKVVSKRTAGAVAQFLLSDLERGRDIIASVEEYERGQLMGPLIELSQSWLDGDDSQNHAKAALLMTEVSPTTLRYRLDDLLQSESQEVRRAALRAFIPCMEEFREKSVSDELEKWRLAFLVTEARAIAKIDLINPIPKRFRKSFSEIDASASETVAEDTETTGKETTSGNDQLDQIGSFFGSGHSSEDEETEAEEAAASEEFSPLDLAASLFGNATEDATSETGGGDVEDSEGVSQVDPSRLGEASYWLVRWQQRDESVTRPTWVRSCETILRQLAESEGTTDDDQIERRWANAALVTCGDIGSADGVLQAAQVASDLEPGSNLVVAWLPANQRLNWVRDHLDELASPKVDVSSARVWESATSIESQEIAGVFDEFLRTSEELSNESLARIVDLMERSLIGGLGDRYATHTDEDDLVTDETGLLAKQKTSGVYPGQAKATQWLVERYALAESEGHRAVLLTVLARISHRHATAEALHLIDKSQDDGILLHSATLLALDDLLTLSVDRAVALLDHPHQSVVDAALLRLSSEDAFEKMQTENIGVPVVYRNQNLHPLQLTNHSFSKDRLNQIRKSDNRLSAAIADTLLVSLGEELPLDALLDRLGGIGRPLTLLTIALAKAERIDEDAIDVYRRCAQVVDWQDEEAVRTALRSLRNDSVDEIIKTHLQESDDMFTF